MEQMSATDSVHRSKTFGDAAYMLLNCLEVDTFPESLSALKTIRMVYIADARPDLRFSACIAF